MHSPLILIDICVYHGMKNVDLKLSIVNTANSYKCRTKKDAKEKLCKSLVGFYLACHVEISPKALRDHKPV